MIRKTTGILLGLTLLSVLNPVIANASSYWSNSNNNWCYIEDGVKKTGWVNDNGQWYYLGIDGNMKTGWINDKGLWYYLQSNGAMAYDITIDGCYLNSSGVYVESVQEEKLSTPVFTGMELLDKFKSIDYQYIGFYNYAHDLAYNPNANVMENGAWKVELVRLEIADLDSIKEGDINTYDIRLLPAKNDSITNVKLKETLQIIDSENADLICSKANEVFNMSSGGISLRIGKRDYRINKYLDKIDIQISPITYK